MLIAAAVMIDPLWQQLDLLAGAGVNTAAYADTVLSGVEYAR